MPLFYTPKPRRFHYEPRFYNPEKERWEDLKRKYAEASDPRSQETSRDEGASGEERGLAYYQQRVQSLDREERKRHAKLSVADLFRKREMPTFHYQPRFSNNAEGQATSEGAGSRHKHKIARRFDMGDVDYMKPVPAGKIMMYALGAILLLMWILM